MAIFFRQSAAISSNQSNKPFAIACRKVLKGTKARLTIAKHILAREEGKSIALP